MDLFTTGMFFCLRLRPQAFHIVRYQTQCTHLGRALSGDRSHCLVLVSSLAHENQLALGRSCGSPPKRRFQLYGFSPYHCFPGPLSAADSGVCCFCRIPRYILISTFLLIHGMYPFSFIPKHSENGAGFEKILVTPPPWYSTTPPILNTLTKIMAMC